MSVASKFFTHGKKAVCIGRNYAAHIKELNNTTPSEPFFFLKPTSSYTKGALEIPRGVVVHHEVELGVVIGKTGRDIKAADAYEHVAGQDAAKAKGLPWSAAKGFDTACTLGEFIDAPKIKDPHNLDLWYKINGETKQSDSTELMLYKIPELIEFCSGIMTLEEGDLLLTGKSAGTPQGVGPVKAGDRVTAGLVQNGETLATLEHECADRQGGYQFKGKL
ncbi:hypothetical protein OIO90_000204 [Microbotryomycetes sp. JL221]|nr:hypothetical protein OIO90_000204 [Microbotryomycetes sp. JL221]